MSHHVRVCFWRLYRSLPDEVRELADKNYALLEENPRHPSLRFKKVGPYWSARVGRGYRALAEEEHGDFYWFWIGAHDEYEAMIAKKRKQREGRVRED